MKFLILAFDNLGDTVMASAVAGALKSLSPNAQVGLWTKAYSSRALHGHPDLDFLHASDPFWDSAPGAGKGAIVAFLKTLQEVRRKKYDAAFVLGTEWRRALCAYLCGATQRIGYPVRKSAPLLTVRVPWEKHGPHTIDDHLALVDHFFATKLDHAACVPRLGLTPAETALRSSPEAMTRLDGSPIVVLHPFSGDPRRIWPLERYFTLTEKLASRLPQARFVLFMGPREEALIKRSTNARIVIPSDQSLSNVKAVLSLAQLFIGSDSGLGHIAAGLAVPVLSLCGGFSQPERHRPWGRSRVLLLKKDSLRDLEVEEVAEAALEMLAAGSP
jgi:ADP-heptose:LPS heptosyltransferase